MTMEVESFCLVWCEKIDTKLPVIDQISQNLF